MKTLTDITTSLELSRQLKDAGFPQNDSLFYWWTDSNDGTSRGIYDHQPFNPQNGWDSYAAPTSTEILAELPVRTKIPTSFIIKDWEQWELSIVHFNGEWTIQYVCGGRGSEHVDVVQDESAKSLANAAAKMYLYLVKNGLLKIGEE